MVALAWKELRKGLSTPKVPKVPTPLNAIAIECECDQSLMCNVMDQCCVEWWWMEGHESM
jgi:hypothetical protein